MADYIHGGRKKPGSSNHHSITADKHLHADGTIRVLNKSVVLLSTGVITATCSEMVGSCTEAWTVCAAGPHYWVKTSPALCRRLNLSVLLHTDLTSRHLKYTLVIALVLEINIWFFLTINLLTSEGERSCLHLGEREDSSALNLLNLSYLQRENSPALQHTLLSGSMKRSDSGCTRSTETKVNESQGLWIKSVPCCHCNHSVD